MKKGSKMIVGAIFIPIFLVLGRFAIAKSGSSLDRDLTLTAGQKLILDQFRDKVIGRLPYAFMKEEIYLIRWLRARNFNLDQAEQMLFHNVNWRHTNKVDTILQEDWTEFKEKFPYLLETFSKDGQPVFITNYGEWDIREIAISGRMPELTRYIARFYEDAMTRIRRLQESGKNVTQFNVLLNLDNLSMTRQGCMQCLSFWANIPIIYENYYSGFVDNVIVINTSPIFETLWNVASPLMSQISRSSFQILGRDKSDWDRVLGEIIDKEQLTPEFGGTYEWKRPSEK